MNAGAALDAARVVFEGSIGRAPAEATRTPEWREVATALVTPHARGVAMWRASEHVLQAVVGRAELTGQALVGEARRLQFLTLGDAHALVALQGWVDGLDDAATAIAESPPGDIERSVAREAWLALEHAADRPRVGATSPNATVAATSSTTLAPDVPTRMSADAPLQGAAAWAAASPSPRKPWYATTGFLVGVLMLVATGAALSWWLLGARRSRDFDDGVAAYARGSRDDARLAFARAAARRPDDARPVVYLGRIAREEGDIARARRLLEVAVRLDPSSAAGQRELASALLADGQPELARRFYVRAIELDLSDRLAQGFLACALHQLGRLDESRRWLDRAGAGAWSGCVTVPIPPPVPGAVTR